MAVEFAVADVAYPYTCAVYRCDCGQTEACHGSCAGSPPPDWRIERSGSGEIERAVCPACAAQTARAAGAPIQPVDVVDAARPP